MAKLFMNDVNKVDSQNMFDTLKNFPNQIKDAIEIGKNAPLFSEEPVCDDYLILGMGGSAIGGDLLSSFCANTSWGNHLRISSNRSYTIPGWLNSTTNVIASSYSGNTEETIAGFEAALKVTKRIVCITTGGKLEMLAQENNIPVIKIPAGYQPRCALAYSFFPMLYVLLRNGAFKEEARHEIEFWLNDLLDLMFTKSAVYTDLSNGTNPAFVISEKLNNSVPVIYSAGERLESVNLRWRCQINENAKQLAYGSYLPEMNHNEINAWANPAELIQKFSIIFMRDPFDNPRVKIRFNAIRSLLESSVKHIIEIKGDGENLLSRMFDLIYLGDWVSYYLAVLNNTDPTPIPFINKLKDILSKE